MTMVIGLLLPRRRLCLLCLIVITPVLRPYACPAPALLATCPPCVFPCHCDGQELDWEAEALIEDKGRMPGIGISWDMVW